MSASVILLIISIYLTILAIKQHRNLFRFKGIIDIETEQKKIQSRLEAETQKLQKTVKNLQNNNADANFIRIPRAEQFRRTQAIIAREEQKDTGAEDAMGM